VISSPPAARCLHANIGAPPTESAAVDFEGQVPERLRQSEQSWMRGVHPLKSVLAGAVPASARGGANRENAPRPPLAAPSGRVDQQRFAPPVGGTTRQPGDDLSKQAQRSMQPFSGMTPGQCQHGALRGWLMCTCMICASFGGAFLAAQRTPDQFLSHLWQILRPGDYTFGKNSFVRICRRQRLKRSLLMHLLFNATCAACVSLRPSPSAHVSPLPA